MNAVATVNDLSESFRIVPPRAGEIVKSWLDDFTRLYLLAFLLTADKVLAEQCFSDAMEDSLDRSGPLTDWTSGTAKGAVIRRAIQEIRPAPKRVHSWSSGSGAKPLLAAAHEPFSLITSLGAFERFIFVLTVLEGHAEEECAALLECGLDDIASGRVLANKLIETLEIEDELQRNSDALPVTTALLSGHCGLC